MTYCSDAAGRATESPYSPDVATWWSDCYGECPRMFYHAFAAMPEWAPPGEDHILYSEGVLTRVAYQPGLVAYHAVEPAGTEYLRLRFRPATVTLDGSPLELATGESSAGWGVRELEGGDYAVTVRHARAGAVCLRAASEVVAAPGAVPARLVIDGATVFQPIDGFGVNLNHRSWAGGELQPVLDAFIGDAGMTVFRVVFDNTDWEEPNDNGDPRVADEAYYQARYGSPRFQPLWDLMAELNRRGLSRHAFFNFMGPGPAWMGGGTLGPGMEAEWAEMIASLLAYARHTRGLRFGLVAPNNEPDIQNEGIHMDAAVYARCLHELAAALERNGLGDVRWIAPDRAGGGTAYLPELLADPVIVAKLAHVGIHSYSAGGGSGGVREFLRSSVCPDRTFWMTEFNVWCPTCDSGTRGNYDWATSRGTAEYLLRHLANGASGGVVWEGVDSLYSHPPAAWSFWGLFAVDDERAATKTYTARKSFHAVAQISRWVRPGARRIDVAGEPGPLAPVLAFRDTGRGDVTLVGVNPSAAPVELRGTLASLPAVTELTLGFTSATANAAAGGTCAVRDGAFALRIPPDCVFTLTSATGAVPP